MNHFEISLPAIQTILDKLKVIDSKIELIQKKKPNDEVWLNSKDAAKALGITTRTLFSYKNQFLIPFSQFGREIRYRAEDVQQFLMDHYVKATIEGRRGE